MGPIELLFFVMIGLFGAIGLVRKYQRELGVTTMLLIALFVLTFLQDRFAEQVYALFTRLGVPQSNVMTAYAFLACGVLAFVAFISYEGIGLTFFEGGRNWFLSLMVGLINGYLFAGSVWYYLDQAGWPLGRVVPEYSAVYEIAVQLLPPEIMSSYFFIGLAIFMLILRVLK